MAANMTARWPASWTTLKPVLPTCVFRHTLRQSAGNSITRLLKRLGDPGIFAELKPIPIAVFLCSAPGPDKDEACVKAGLHKVANQ